MSTKSLLWHTDSSEKIPNLYRFQKRIKRTVDLTSLISERTGIIFTLNDWYDRLTGRIKRKIKILNARILELFPIKKKGGI